MPSTLFSDCCREIEQHAADMGSSTPWPEHSKTILSRVHEALGGRWALADCGVWRKAGHPQAGEPAYAVLHMAMWYVLDTRSSSATTTKAGAWSSGDAPELHLLKQPARQEDLPAGSTPLIYYAAYELGDNHWPTGRLYNSASQLEGLTSHANNRKPENSFRLVCRGLPAILQAGRGRPSLMSLYQWHRHVPGSKEYGMQKPKRAQRFFIENRYRQEVQQLGVDVETLRAKDAPSVVQSAKRSGAPAWQQ